jgi:hypothetical protein
MADYRMQFEAMVSLTAVQIDRNRGDRDVSQRQSYDHIAPPWQRHQTGSEPGQVIERHRVSPATIGYQATSDIRPIYVAPGCNTRLSGNVRNPGAVARFCQ